MKKLFFMTIILLTAIGGGLSARSYMARAEKFCEDSLSRCIRNGHLSANWINDGSRWFWYSSEDAEGKNWYLADTKTGKKINRPIDDFNHLMDAMRYALEEYSTGPNYSFK